MTPIRLATLSLTRHKFSTVISVCSIAIGIAICGILLRLHHLSESRFSILGKGGDAIVGAKAGGIDILLNSLNAEGEYPDFLPFALYQSLKSGQSVQHSDGVRTTGSSISAISPVVYFGKYENYRVIGTDESFFKYTSGFKDGGWSNTGKNIVVGFAVAKAKKLQLGDVVKIHPWIGDEINEEEEFTISGILEETRSTWDRSIFSNIESAHQILRQNSMHVSGKSIWRENVLHYFLIDLKPNTFLSLKDLVNKRTVGQVILVEREMERLKGLTGAGKKIGFLVMAFVIFLGGLSICAMLITRFEGMVLQLAVLSAIGYTKNEISKSLLWEGGLIGLLGVFVGAFIDLAFFPIIRSLLHEALPSPEIISSSIWDSALIWVIALLATICSVFIPMARIYKQDAHSLLRGM